MAAQVHRITPNDAHPTVEYPLGDPELVSIGHARLDPWIRGLLGLSEAGIREELGRRWNAISFDGTRAIRRIAIQYRPKSIVIREEESLLLLEHVGVNADAGRSWDFFLVPPAPDSRDVARALARHGFEKQAELNEFLCAFGGLSEDIHVSGARFAVPTRLDSYVLSAGSWLPDRNWIGSLVLYVGLSGDTVLLHRNGQVACLVHEMRAIVDLKIGLDEFLQEYARFRSERTIFDRTFR